MRIIRIFSYLQSSLELRWCFVWFYFSIIIFLLIQFDFVIDHSHFLVLCIFYNCREKEFLYFLFQIDKYLLWDYIFRFIILINLDFWFDENEVVFWIWKLIVLNFVTLQIQILVLKIFNYLESILKFQSFFFILKDIHWVLFLFDVKCLYKMLSQKHVYDFKSVNVIIMNLIFIA